jgi:hypothetical protein
MAKIEKDVHGVFKLLMQRNGQKRNKTKSKGGNDRGEGGGGDPSTFLAKGF